MPTLTKKPKARPRNTSAKPANAPFDPVADYAEQVVSGRIVAGPDVRASCRRHLKDLKTAHKRGLVWRLDKALFAIGFIEEVCKLKNGEPFLLQPWQKFIVGSLFGWYGDDGIRRFRTAFVEIGKGNGKSPLAAAIGIFMMVADGEPFAEVYAAATMREQAMIAFRSAVVMVDKSPELSARVSMTPAKVDKCWQLSHTDSGSFFKAISSEVTSGPRIHCALVDEIHEHKDPALLEILMTGVGKCRRSLIFEITNSGVDRTSICFQHHEYSQQVAHGYVENDAWFSYVCSLDEGEDPLEDEACWIKANPNLNVSIFEKELRTAVREAKGMPAAASKKRRLHFCQWVDAASPWIGVELWLPCEVEHLDALELWRGRECYGGLDLSGTTDLTALALVFPGVNLPGDPAPVLGGRLEFFTPKDTLLERARRDRVPYDVWTQKGYMTATPGRSVDYGVIIQRLKVLTTIVKIVAIAFDPYRIHDFKREMAEVGLSIPLTPHPQGVTQAKESGLWMPRSIELTEGEIFGERLAMEPNPCLRWNVAGVVCEQDPKGNRYFTKRKAAGRIDGALALVQAIGAALTVEAPKSSVYETRGILAI